jgi:hypothetical protein
MPRKPASPDQGDLFHEPVYPVRLPRGLDGAALRSKIARAMSEALRECKEDRYVIAGRIAQELGRSTFSKAMLDSYTSESNETHTVSLVVFIAFVRATGCFWLWDFLLQDEGFTVLQGDEARLAEIGRAEQDRKEIEQRLKALKAAPVIIGRRPR